MDSFHEPRRISEPIKLEDLTAEVLTREAEYRAKDIPLSGRILHVCHYLPITATLEASSRPGIISPPATPPNLPADIPPIPSGHTTTRTPESNPRPRWSLATRQGHAAMISGIRSLSATHEQVIIGWTGDIESPTSTSGESKNPSPDIKYFTRPLTDSGHPTFSAGEKLKIPTASLSDEDKAALEEEIANFSSEDEDVKTRTTYVPILLDDKVAHGHYDGYCKQSGC